ncbi:hypothetical protein A9Q99_16200 [Gammaproteobacteria bacterium 45_16_T64]|nr:hypothetical protein A9Q99_16200 [Gammaproteobacteria bacterium 45_16_T64]
MSQPVATLTLEQLHDKDAIRELRYRYCRAVDTQDFKTIEACFIASATIDFGSAGKLDSRDALLDMMRTYAQNNSTIGLHTAHNPIIEFNSKTSASAHWVTQFTSYDPSTNTALKQSGTFVDQYIKTNEGWKITHCCYTILFHNSHSSNIGTPII